MVAVKAQHVMDKLLNCEKSEQLPDSEALDCLIYRNPDSLPTSADHGDHIDRIWTATRDKVTVQIWESRANIRISVAPDSHPNISMKEIADIAAKAIVDELRRDTQ